MMLMSFMIFGSTLVSGSPTELQRLNYGVVFESQDPVQLATESWIHKFAIELPESINIVDLTGCSEGPKTCKIVNEVLLEINQVREETEVMINNTIDSIIRLIPERNLVKQRSRRALLPFIGSISKSIFGTATTNDVENLARHINALNKLTRNMANSIQQHDNNLSSYMHTMDRRIENIVEGMKENEMAIQHIQTQLYETFGNLERSFSTMSVLIAKQIQKSRKLEHLFNKLLDGIYDLVEGKLSPHLVAPSVMATTLSDFQGLLHDKFSGYNLVYKNHHEIYKNVDIIFTRQGSKLFISVKFPISTFNKPLSLFKVISLPVPINNTSNHATQLLDLPQLFAITGDSQYYGTFDMTELNSCKTGKTKICTFNKALYPITHDTCISALFNDDKSLIKANCNFRFLISHLSSEILPLSHTTILVYNVDIVEFDCKTGQRMVKGCNFCIIHEPCECSVSTATIYLPQRLSTCNQNTTSRLHPVNLALLQQFFNDTELQNIDSNSLFENPLSVDVPQFQIYNHTMQNIIADDRKAHLSLEKMAQSAKTDAMVFQSLTDPLLTGDIMLEDNWPSTDDILLYCTTSIAAFCLIALILISLKLRKLMIVVSVLQNTGVQKVQATTLPSFIYKKPETTPAPTNYIWEQLGITLDHYILAFVIMSCVMVSVLLVKTCTCRLRNRSCQIVLELTNGFSCVFVPIYNLSMCPTYWNIRVPQSISCISIQGLWTPILSFDWDDFHVENKLTHQKNNVASTVRVGPLAARRIRHIMHTSYSANFYAKHGNLLIPLN
ncbi:uncharacterized protein LOC128238123 isoform X1 [Mya arenaria]|uniref:uncharacterized protein LOC128238123 isoform X1 n=1 Tax=Mya arenaria TaxID=6604 RepID=UPI0022E048B4|nr:uncharacterized protein LOC128238123 isoform X1 [Mya arenaria]XP_052809656.1 uncharacterized protein LOC128238123 isoform X1 [Mya arenaria]